MKRGQTLQCGPRASLFCRFTDIFTVRALNSIRVGGGGGVSNVEVSQSFWHVGRPSTAVVRLGLIYRTAARVVSWDLCVKSKPLSTLAAWTDPGGLLALHRAISAGQWSRWWWHLTNHQLVFHWDLWPQKTGQRSLRFIQSPLRDEQFRQLNRTSTFVLCFGGESHQNTKQLTRGPSIARDVGSSSTNRSSDIINFLPRSLKKTLQHERLYKQNCHVFPVQTLSK